MRLFEKQRFGSFDDRDSRRVFESTRFERCEFNDCILSMAKRPELRSTIRNCQLVKSTVHQNCTIQSAIVEDCLVDGLHTKGQMFFHGAVYKHVVIRGKVGRIMLARPNGWDTGQAQLFVAANDLFYQGVDWALDITQCESADLNLISVPGHLVRRDPTTQILVTREKALANGWERVDVSGTPYDLMIEQMIADGRESEAFVAPIRHRSLPMHLAAQKRLREAGVAEPV